VIFNSENADEWAPPCQTPRAAPGPPGSAPLPHGCHAPRRSHATAVGTAGRPPARLAPLVARPTASRCPSLALPLVPPSQPPRSEAADVRSVAMPPRRSPVAVMPRRRPRAGEPPRSSADSRAPVGTAVRPPCSAAAARCAVVRLGRARFRPSGTRFRFYIF
jgi:hypothetical protein